MRKQSIANRKYFERLERDDPGHLRELRHRQQLGSAKSFIRHHARLDDLQLLHKTMKERKDFLKKDLHNT